ncbi:metallophosphoesterase family protein [Pararhizobium gei]|uniref:metallophosphoesterase family protein n=1 Tax=Pararhizobium gei TaxID=1395951 RepID=UPI0023DB7264|nr:metallophosphoesterase [Rhizobium gei]
MDTIEPSRPPLIAVVADAHFHDIYGDYGFEGLQRDGRRLTLRLLADTARSTRVFNESHAALHRTLDSIAQRGIRHVVLLGDYSDDGQIETVRGVEQVLETYSKRFGMRFYATVGNHDIFGVQGRHRSKRVLDADGGYCVVSSDPALRDPSARSIEVSEAMYCRGYPDGLDIMARCGFFPTAGDLHWETPFGADGDPGGRMYDVRSPDGRTLRRLMDASYLIEPFAGVWLLMIDANVFVPVDRVPVGQPGDLADSTGAGWNAMLRHKPFIFDWIRDVTRRARHLGKVVLAFSHYPVIDPLDETADDEIALLGRTGMSERIPGPAVANALSEAGLDVHFSGHLHVNDTARHRTGDRVLVNIAVPSLVAFPAAYKIVSIGTDTIDVETVDLGDMQLSPLLRKSYQREIAHSGLKSGAMMEATDYGSFLSAHLGHLTSRRYLKRDWPKDLAEFFRAANLSDLAILAFIEEPIPTEEVFKALSTVRERHGLLQSLSAAGAEPAALSVIPAVDFLADWYRLRMGSELALDWIGKGRMALYRAVSTLYAEREWLDQQSVQHQISLVFRMLEKYLDGLPSRNFRVNRVTGAVLAIEATTGVLSETGAQA